MLVLADDPTIGVTVASLACCSLEVDSAVVGGLLVESENPVDVNILVVSGTVTHALSEQLAAVWAGLAEPKRVVSFGACANSGGPYWDAPSVLPGVAEMIPIDVFVPGCPPRPAALVDGIRLAAASRG